MKRIWRRYPGALRDMAVALTLTGAGWMDLHMLLNNRWCNGYSTPVMQEQLPLFLMRPAGFQLLVEAEGPPWTLSSSSSFCCTANGYLHVYDKFLYDSKA